jgi:hypothetical protein
VHRRYLVKQNERSHAVGQRDRGDRIRHRDVGSRAIVHRKQGKQVGKDSGRARRADCFYPPVTILPQIHDQLSGRRLNNIAVRSSRHQAILHLAARGQLTSQPQSHDQQYNRNCQAGDRRTPVSALFGVVHCPANPRSGRGELSWCRGALLSLLGPKMTSAIHSPAILMASRRPRLYTVGDRETDHLTTDNERDKAGYEWI